MSKKPTDNDPSSSEDPIRPHVFDGIAEFDKKMPNWWLFTLYASIAFSVVYWFYSYKSGLEKSDGDKVQAYMAKVEAVKLANATAFDDATLWQMSRNPVFIDAGKATFNTTCASCHLASLKGKSESPSAVGVNLADTLWIYGAKPADVLHTVTTGASKGGMPAWGPVLGPKRVAEVVAYVLSYHKEGEPVTVVPSGK